MSPVTFSNAIVATVGAYAEVVSELSKQVETLTAALRTSNAREAAVLSAARNVCNASEDQLPGAVAHLRAEVFRDVR
jgi:hypothetical protein